MLNDILILDQQWLPNQSDFPPISWPLYRAWPSPIMSGFHWAFATGVACQQGTLTLPDTWFRPPLWDLLVLQLLRPDSSNLSCLYSTFHLEYPLVLSRFCFVRLRLWSYPTDSLFKICTYINVHWSKGWFIPITESSHLLPSTSNTIFYEFSPTIPKIEKQD